MVKTEKRIKELEAEIERLLRRAHKAETELTTLRARVAKLWEALIDARDEYAGMRWGEDHEYREAGERVERIIDAVLKETGHDKG